MSLRIDSTEWITGALLIGNTGGGVLAENIPSSGTNGPGYVYDKLSFPADNGKEICGRITTFPLHGTLNPCNEDTSFLYTPITSSVDSFTYDLYKDYVLIGSYTVTVSSGGKTSVVASGSTSSANLAIATQLASFIASGSKSTANIAIAAQLSSLAVSGSTSTANLGISVALASSAASQSTGSANITAGAVAGLSSSAVSGSTSSASLTIPVALSAQAVSGSTSTASLSLASGTLLPNAKYLSAGIIRRNRISAGL